MEMVERLASIHCTNTEIGSALSFDPSILSKPKYSEIVAKGRERGKLSLRRKMMETAMNGNVTMQIWLSKQYLGMSDKLEQKSEITGKDGEPLIDNSRETLQKIMNNPDALAAAESVQRALEDAKAKS
jgi:hypothetical protein